MSLTRGAAVELWILQNVSYHFKECKGEAGNPKPLEIQVSIGPPALLYKETVLRTATNCVSYREDDTLGLAIQLMILIALLLVQILHLNSLGVCYYFFGASCIKTVFNIVVNLVIVAIDPIDLIWMTIDHQKVFVTMVTSGLQVAFLIVRKNALSKSFPTHL